MTRLYWLSPLDEPTTARLTIWHGAGNAIAERPLAGYGPDALGVMFQYDFPPQLVYCQGSGVIAERAHNLLLDLTLKGGLLHVAAWLRLLPLIFVGALKFRRRAMAHHVQLMASACQALVSFLYTFVIRRSALCNPRPC